jgi:hypothetical protein
MHDKYKEVKSSGEEERFAGGAVRDVSADKPRPDLISPFFEERLGNWLMLGAKRYDERNWEKGLPAQRCYASLKRHLMQWAQGLRDEDHLAAVACNLMFIIHFEEMIKRGLLPKELADKLDDMPTYYPVEKLDEAPETE